MTRRRALSLTGLALLGAAAGCSSDAPTGLRSLASPSFNQSEGRGVFQRYVAIGTSVSMGWRSDGVVDSTQATSWPAQLAALGGRTLSQPYIARPGCPALVALPITSGLRTDGEPVLGAAALNCSPLRSDVTLPVANVAISGALTSDALLKTPETSGEPAGGGLYHRVLQPLHTQVSTMVEQNPKLVSVELGAADVLGARSGVAIPAVGGSMVPLALWQQAYVGVLNQVSSTTKMAVLVGLINDVSTFPAFRTGNEIWQDRLTFAAVNIAVNADCNGSPNLLFLPVKLLTALQAAAQMAAAHLGPFNFSCTAGAPNVVDLILTPAEVAVVNTQMHQMSAFIQAQAQARGFAYFDLGALYDRPALKPTFSLAALLQSPTPFGPLMSLDGIHPSAAGATVLAKAAAHALNVTYNLGIPE